MDLVKHCTILFISQAMNMLNGTKYKLLGIYQKIDIYRYYKIYLNIKFNTMTTQLISSIFNRIEKLEQNNNEANNKIEQLENNNKILEQNNNNANNKIEQLENKISELDENMNKANIKIEQLENKTIMEIRQFIKNIHNANYC